MQVVAGFGGSRTRDDLQARWATLNCLVDALPASKHVTDADRFGESALSGHIGPRKVGIDKYDAEGVASECYRQVDGYRGSADARLASGDDQNARPPGAAIHSAFGPRDQAAKSCSLIVHV